MTSKIHGATHSSATRRPAHSAAGVIPAQRLASGDVEQAPQRTLLARFWGVRGSYVTPRVGGGSIGGETTCLELRAGERLIIIDAGSGIIALGEELMRRANANPGQRQEVILLLTHAHHDHLCGLPFFAPLYDARFDIRFYGADLAGMRFADIIAGYMRAPYFPVDFHALPSRRTLTTLKDGDRLLISPTGEPRIVNSDAPTPDDTLTVDALFSSLHPSNGTMVYRFTYGAASLVFATDVEVRGQDLAADERLIAFARDVDLLVHDAQYSEEDYDGAESKHGFGHSTPAMAMHVARQAGARRLALFHHDPHYDDDAVLALERLARQDFPDVFTAREGLELRLDGARQRLV